MELLAEYEKITEKMATELKGFVNEVGFVKEKDDGFYIKFYSSECEVEFCGHATIAIMYDLLLENPRLQSEKILNIHVNAGKLSAFNHMTDLDAVYIMAPAPLDLEVDFKKSEVANALMIEDHVINTKYPVRMVDGGLRTLIVPIIDLENCLEINPNERELKQFCLNNEIDIVLVFTDDTHNDHARFRTRVFAPKFGYLEDPATGSGNSAFGYYLISLELWNGDMIVEQSANRENANFIKLKAFNNKDVTHILFGGCATRRIDGKYHLHI